jgi:hypothetical protein
LLAELAPVTTLIPLVPFDSYDISLTLSNLPHLPVRQLPSTSDPYRDKSVLPLHLLHELEPLLLVLDVYNLLQVIRQ